MAVLTMKQYKRIRQAKEDSDTKLVEQIMNESYGEDSSVIDVEEILSHELDYDEVVSDKSAGMSNGEIAKKYNVTVQKINSIIKKGSL